jgi:hypothetical protein
LLTRSVVSIRSLIKTQLRPDQRDHA